MGIISTNTLFHFTPKLKYLEGILKSNFIPRYNLEKITLGNHTFKIGIPMVCFCDIPLSSISNHLNKYGQYAIGMSQKWANKKKLNPVLYIKKNSSLSKQLWNLSERILLKLEKDDVQLRIYVADILRYLKPFEGKIAMIGGGSKLFDIKFYDEREWRYVPDITRRPKVGLITEKVFKELSDKSLPDYNLPFTPKDIKYLIVSKDTEISGLVKTIEASKANYAFKDVMLLHSRIMTVDQIKSDF